MPKHIIIDARVRRSSTGRYADQLVEHLQDIDHTNRYTILVAPDDDWQMHNPNFTTLPSPFPQFSLNPLNELRFAWQLYRLKPDLVHFTMTQQPLLYFGNIVTMTHDLTMLYITHRRETNPIVFWFRRRLYPLLLWWAHKKSKRILVPTNTVAQELAGYQPFTKHKLVVTYESIGVLPTVKAKKPAIGLKGEYIMYQGTGFPHKNLGNLIAAFDIIHKAKPELTLVMVGKMEKHYQDVKREAASHPSYGHIIFTGFMPDENSRWLFEHATLYIMPSLMEGFSMTALEAMAYGTPVVSSDASVLPEVYGPGAYYCNARNPSDIAAKALEVLDSPALQKKLIAGAAKQLKKYSWEKTAKETLAVYQSLLKD
jgi:glycosyltransferase involved in cell wall biosynthesis